jgi:putative glutamine amidotransferase
VQPVWAAPFSLYSAPFSEVILTAPVIGITSNYTPPKEGKFGTIAIGEAYVQAVLSAGGLPVILPVGLSGEDLQTLFARLDGLLLTGGGDIDPVRFAGLPHPRVYDIDERRDALEIRLVQMAAETGKPFLGICRGIQVINVALGGTLFTDISDQLTNSLRHDWYPNIPRDYLSHPVSVAKGSLLAQVLGGEAFEVNSLHHQGLERLAPALRVAAYAPDHLIEGVELPGHPFGLGVQWHPEWLQEHAPQRQLFHALVRAADHGA